MPSKSMAFYARYDYPLSNMWYYDHEKDIYLSNGSGSRTIEGLGGVSGKYSATFNVKNASTTGIGIIWNATIAEVNNPYDYTTGSTYWYMHLNPTNGGFQLANVVTDYTVAGGVTLANSPSAWQEKWNAYKLNGGTLSMKFSVEFCDSFIKLYVDDNLLLTYEGELLGSVKGTGVGMRTNALGNEVIKTEFETLSYDTMYNWEYNSTNKTYTSQGAGIAPIVDMGGYSYGVYSADLKVGDTTTTGIGIIWGATIANVVNPYDYATGSSYWYFHHNPNAGTFQLANVSVEKNAYKAVKSVTLANAPANFQTKWNTWNDGGKTADYVINMKVEFTHESITMYIDGDLLLTFNASSTNGEYFGSLSGKTIGVRTNKAGNIVSNVSFTPYQYNWEYNETNKTYTSIGAGIVPTNLTAGTSGTYSADFTINPSSITSSSMGIFFNGTMSKEDLPYEGQCKYFYLNLNVHNGGNFQLAKLDGSYKSLAYVYKTNLTSWNAKWSAWNDGGRAEALTFNLKVEFSATSIKVYVDNELITTYSGEDVGSLSGTAVGVRTNFAGNVVTNAVFTPSGT